MPSRSYPRCRIVVGLGIFNVQCMCAGHQDIGIIPSAFGNVVTFAALFQPFLFFPLVACNGNGTAVIRYQGHQPNAARLP